MRTYQKISYLCSKLSLDKQKQVLEIVQKMVDDQAAPDSYVFKRKTKRPNPRYCVYCGSEGTVVKSGKRNMKQRYQCKECLCTFSETTHTIRENSHAYSEDWEIVIADTLNGEPLDNTANKINMSHMTVFNMRHKVLLGIVKYLENSPIVLKEIAELDETYVLESRKGSKFQEDAPRPPRLHGEGADKRGLSSEQVCICAGVQRNHGSAFASTVNRANPCKEEIKDVFGGHIGSGTVIFTDGAKSYSVLEEDLECAIEKVDIEEEKQRKVANLNNVNSFHAFIKERYGQYRGVATKYLNRYNALFSSAFRNRDDMIELLCNELLTPGIVDYSNTITDVEDRELLEI